MKIYALVGGSGTGKSYKALEVAYENEIDYIIDDGILIYKNKIIAGISAKKAKTVIEAVKTAIFNKDEHMQDVKTSIQKETIDKLLILGTSRKMIKQIADRLEIGEVYKFIDIEDISTSDEIDKAKKSRERGNHIIPVPTVQIKYMTSGLSINPLRRFFRKNNQQSRVFEKTIVRPNFSYIGKFYISEDVIPQILTYEIEKCRKIEKIVKIDVNNFDNNVNIYINITINDTSVIKELEGIQRRLIKAVEQITLINVGKIDIYISKMKKTSEKVR